MKRRSLFIAFIFIAITLLASSCQGRDGAFGPIFPTPTQIGIINRPPVPVNFETLNSDPFVFVNRFVRVTGRFSPADGVFCERQRGPAVDWLLISDELEMNMSGFGSVVNIAPNQMFFTVDGIWRQYDGPVGCAKEPQDKTVWYLEVVRIVEPNPIVANINVRAGSTVIPGENIASDPQPELATPELEETPSTTVDPLLTPTPTPTQNNQNGATLVPTFTPVGVVPAPSGSTPTRTVPAGSTATATPTATPTVVPSVDANASPTETSAAATPTPADSDGDDGGEDDGGLGGTGGGVPNPATPVPTVPNGYPSPIPPTADPGATTYP